MDIANQGSASPPPTNPIHPLTKQPHPCPPPPTKSAAVPSPYHRDPGRCPPRLRHPITVFSVKVTRHIHAEYQTTWYRIKTFGALAEACLSYLHQDRLVQVTGNHMSAWAKPVPPSNSSRPASSSSTHLMAVMNTLPTGDNPFAQAHVTIPEIAVEELVIDNPWC